MPLRPCRVCGQPVARNAIACGRCGIANPAPSFFNKPLHGMIADVFRWLFTTLGGAIVLAAVGLSLTCCGPLALIVAGTERATKVAVRDLETRGAPQGSWLEVTDGYLFWPRLKSTYEEKSGAKETTAYYAPLVSKAVLDTWLEEYRRDRDKAVYPFDGSRVMVKVEPAAFKRAFPGAAKGDDAKPFERHDVKGRVLKFQEEPEFVREGLGKQARDFKPERIILLHYGQEPIGLGGAVAGSLCAGLAGLGLAAPLGVRLVRRRSRPGPGAAREAAGLYDRHGLRFRYPRDWTVTTVPGGDGSLRSGRIDIQSYPSTAIQFFFFPGLPGTAADTARTAMGALIETATKNARLHNVRLGPLSRGTLAGLPSHVFDFTATLPDNLPGTGRTEAVVVRDLTLVFFWLVWDTCLAACRPGLDLIQGSLDVTGLCPAAPAAGALVAVPAPQAARYYYSRQGQSFGPVTSGELKQLAASGQLTSGDLIWLEDRKQWVPASGVKGLFPGPDKGRG
jgi:hypothetical protein